MSRRWPQSALPSVRLDRGSPNSSLGLMITQEGSQDSADGCTHVYNLLSSEKTQSVISTGKRCVGWSPGEIPGANFQELSPSGVINELRQHMKCPQPWELIRDSTFNVFIEGYSYRHPCLVPPNVPPSQKASRCLCYKPSCLHSLGTVSHPYQTNGVNSPVVQVPSLQPRANLCVAWPSEDKSQPAVLTPRHREPSWTACATLTEAGPRCSLSAAVKKPCSKKGHTADEEYSLRLRDGSPQGQWLWARSFGYLAAVLSTVAENRLKVPIFTFCLFTDSLLDQTLVRQAFWILSQLDLTLGFFVSFYIV